MATIAGLGLNAVQIRCLGGLLSVAIFDGSDHPASAYHYTIDGVSWQWECGPGWESGGEWWDFCALARFLAHPFMLAN